VGWPVYSERFLAHQGVAGSFSYAVPAGYRAVVRWLHIVNYGAAAAVVAVPIAGVTVYQRTFPAAEASVALELMAVAYAGQTIGAYVAADGFAVTVSGYLLLDPTGRTAPPPGAAGKPVDPPETVPT